MTGTSFIFWIVALVTVASAAMVVFSKNLIYSAMALLFTLMGVAGLYVFLWADFDSDSHLRGGDTGAHHFRYYAHS